MECKSVMEKISSGLALDTDEQIHLLSCHDCQKFSEAYCALMGTSAPSHELDELVLSSVRRISNARIMRRRLAGMIVVSSSVAAIVIACLLIGAPYIISRPESVSFDLQEQWMLDYSIADEQMSDLEQRLQMTEVYTSMFDSMGESVLSSTGSLDSELLALETDLSICL